MIEIRVDIFESGEKVVTHIFYGKTQKEAEAIERAHRKTDEFYRGAVELGRWDGIGLTYQAFINDTTGRGH